MLSLCDRDIENMIVSILFGNKLLLEKKSDLVLSQIFSALREAQLLPRFAGQD